MDGLQLGHTYLDDLLIIGNLTLDDHSHQLQVVLWRLRRAELKVKEETSSFLHITEYLVSMLTKDGIQPIQKKDQAVLDFEFQLP